jgi:hypothetical protein
MKLSTIVKQKTLVTAEGYPIWFWHCVRQRDLPWVKAEGLIWRPEVWLSSTRKGAIGFYPSQDRLILRVNTYMLTADKVHKDAAWRKWVMALRSQTLHAPPASLLQYWARLRKHEDPEASSRLRVTAEKGTFDSQLLRQDLRTQIARVRPDQLWSYEDRIQPEALSVANEAGFYVSLKMPAVTAVDQEQSSTGDQDVHQDAG